MAKLIPEPLLTKAEVADILRLTPETVRRLHARGDLVGVRVCKRGDVRYRASDVSAYIASMTSGREEPTDEQR